MPPIAQFKHTLSRALNRSRAHGEALQAMPLEEVDFATADPRSIVSFRCNLCGRPNAVRFEQLDRETSTCQGCGSTVRFRAIADLLVNALFGQDLRLDEIGPRKDIAGIGLSDADAYALPLARKFDYTNTFFHKEPRLDIANAPQSWAGKYDFVIASDVFEHVVPPISKAFINTRRLLKPGGVFVFTVPFKLDGETVEHFPELFDFSVAMDDGEWTLRNRTIDGRHQTYSDLIFHGGPGSTLEMRVFSRDRANGAIERPSPQCCASRTAHLTTPQE